MTTKHADPERTALPDPDALAAGAARVVEAYMRGAARGDDPWAALPLVLDVKHVAGLLGVSESAVRHAARAGDLPMRQVCGKWRVDRMALREHLGFLARAEDKP